MGEFTDLAQVLIQEFSPLFHFAAVIFAIWRGFVGGLKYLAGEREALGKTAVRIAVGMAVIWFAPNYVYFLVEMYNRLNGVFPTFGG